MANATRTVVLLADHLEIEGEGLRLGRFASRLADRGISARIVCISGGLTSLDAGLGVLECPWLAHRWLRPWATRLLRLGDGCSPPDLIHVFQYDLAKVAESLAEHWHIPLVCRIEEFPDPERSFRMPGPRCKALHVEASELAEDLKRRSGSPIPLIVIPFGIESREKDLLDCDIKAVRVPVIGTCGRYLPRSGHETFLDAAAIVLASGRDVEFLLAGQGPEESELRRRADRLGIADRLTFTVAPQADDSFWQVLDIYCQPAPRPTLARSLAMAMALGVPCVASDVEGLRSLLADGNQGRIIPPADPSALAQAMIELLDDPENARTLGRQGRQSVRLLHDPDHEADELALLYENIIVQSEIASMSTTAG